MLDALNIVHSLVNHSTASRIRRVCMQLSRLKVTPTKYIKAEVVRYRVGDVLHREDGPAIEYKNGHK